MRAAQQFDDSMPLLKHGVLDIGRVSIVMEKVIAVRERSKGFVAVGSTFLFQGGETIDTNLPLPVAADFLRTYRQEAQVTAG